MQISRFSTGGFVLHGITHLAKSRISAWYDAQGALLDAEYPATGRTVRSADVRAGLQTLGPVWAKQNAPA